jgi:hypothetical protein
VPNATSGWFAIDDVKYTHISTVKSAGKIPFDDSAPKQSPVPSKYAEPSLPTKVTVDVFAKGPFLDGLVSPVVVIVNALLEFSINVDDCIPKNCVPDIAVNGDVGGVKIVVPVVVLLVEYVVTTDPRTTRMLER